MIPEDRGGERIHHRAYRLFLTLTLLATVCMFEFLYLRNPVANVSAVEASGSVGVYWDASCSRRAYSIDWGVLSPGETKNVVVYVRNEGNQTIFLSVTASNFAPAGASNYLSFAWSSEGHKVKVNRTVQVTPRLFVSPSTTGISAFSFDLTFEGRTYIAGDLNGDGVVNMYDAILFSSAYESTPRDMSWNPDADLNEDGIVDIYDALMFGARWGASS